MFPLKPPAFLKRCFYLLLSDSAWVVPHASLFFLMCGADVCLLPLEEGSCGRYTMRWYFNSQAQACRPFIYSGCEGNNNRFLHLEECEEICLLEAGGTARAHSQVVWQIYGVWRLTTNLLSRFSSHVDMMLSPLTMGTVVFCCLFWEM